MLKRRLASVAVTLVLFASAINAAPLAKLAGVYKAAKALQVNLNSDEKTMETLIKARENLDLELTLAADAVTTKRERDGLAAYQRARDLASEALSAFVSSSGYTAAMLRSIEQSTKLAEKLGVGNGEVVKSPEMEKENKELREKAERTRTEANVSLDAAHKVYLNKPAPAR